MWYTLLLIYRFVEDLIEDVISVNQYYNKKLESIKMEYETLFEIVETDIQQVSKLFYSYLQKPKLCRGNRRDPSILDRIYNLLGEMLLLQYFSQTNFHGIRKVGYEWFSLMR